MPNIFSIDQLPQAVKHLSAGHILALPTETFYGLAVRADHASALDQLDRLKPRDRNKPYPLLVSTNEMALDFVDDVPVFAKHLIEQFWPGPLTLVLKGRNLPKQVMNSDGGVGLRVTSHVNIRELIAQLRAPITATSANPSGQPPAQDLQQALSYYASEDDMAFLAGTAGQFNKPSTVIDFVTSSQGCLLREGAIPFADITAALADL